MSACTWSANTKAMPPDHHRSRPKKTAQPKTKNPPLTPDGKPACTCSTAKKAACAPSASSTQ
eukprot:CAMPEP_0177261376 /NCGR_PEP_ID=MMETSP0367-20130122/59789_1 /TAXON_ID=447022 ORGANISM="Scrippsiella hangoei-like, Strain SHHI-4" /NCGR_SAMPLE_ID=MMETSP0367 /ASSEMBLY_ACC=CAM_ASM_000362 /LENGTH=61 /DNA_ID=CAMNT_0018716017 /DNA_START=44 /DNA_END=226 /DNA_ORIENTATION=+